MSLFLYRIAFPHVFASHVELLRLSSILQNTQRHRTCKFLLDHLQWFQHSTPTFSTPNTPHHFLFLPPNNSTPIQLLPSPMVFHSTPYPTTFYFHILI